MRKRFLWILIGFALSLSITARLLLSWGVVYGARHHQYILDEAYKKLAADPAFPSSKFPSLSEIQAHEGVNVVASSAINPLGDKTGMFTGPGPDSTGNSKFTQHYFNPATGKGGGPRTIAEHYLGLKSALESRNRVFSGPTIGGDIGYTTAYFAHFMADMNAPYHILGMSAEEAIALIKSGKVMIGEEIAGPTGKGAEDWIKAAGYWYEVYKADKTADWFDPWYWNGIWPATVSTSTHVKWEGVNGTITAAGVLTGYATTFLVAQLSAGNGNQAAFESFAQSEAAFTGSLLREAWLFRGGSGTDGLLDHSIQNVYTVWRATFSALRPDFEVKQDPAADGDKLIVKIKNVEDDDPAKDVVVSVKVKGGELKGPVSHTVDQIPALREVVIDGVWTIEKGTDQTEILIEVKGRFVQTPDSGSAVLERHLQLKKPEKPPAEKPKPDTKEKPTTPVPKKPGEKPPVVTPPPGVPTGGESPGTVPAAGAWVLAGVADKLEPSKGMKPSKYMNPNDKWTTPGKIEFKGSSVTSSDVMTFGDGTTVVRQSSSSWTEFPKMLIPGAPEVLINFSASFQPNELPPSIVATSISAIENALLSVTATGRESRQIQLPASAPRWYLKDRTGPLPRKVIEVSHWGPGGTANRIYTYVWQDGATALITPSVPKAASLGVQIEVDKPTVVPGETALLKATATGGTAPYTYAWAGTASGTSDQLSFTAGKTGTQAFTVTVKDSKGATATASATITTEGPTVTLQRTSSGTVVLGLPYGFLAQLSAAGKPLPGAFVYRWEPHPAVTYSPHEGASTQTTAVFTRPGRTLVWVDVLRQEGPVLVTVAESEQIEIDVVSPELSLAANPSTPFTGQEVRINVTMNPAIQDKYVTFWWEIQGNALNAGPVVVGDAYSRAYTYKPKDTAPVTVTVHSKSKDGGDDLGQKSIAVTAKLYQVKISEPRLMGPPPRVWSEQAKRLVEVPRGIGTFQEFFVNASISPAPPDSPLRYDWKSQPEGCSIYSPGSQETRSSASQAGTFNISVTIRDSQNIVLGSGERTVSIVAPAPEPKKAEPPSKAAEAMAKLKEASALAAEGKLDEAIAAADQASALDPTSRPISSYGQQLKATKVQLLQHLDNVRSLGQKGSFEDASAELAKAKELVPSSPLVAAAEAQLKTLKQQNQAAAQAQKLKAEEQSAAGKQKAADLLNQAKSLYQQGKLDEALAASEEALILDPTNADLGGFVRFFRVALHLSQARNLGNAGRLDEAAAEVAEAKKDDPSQAKILEFEKWLQQLRQQRAAAESKKAETANLQSTNQAAAKEKVKQAYALAKQNKADEALAMSEEALRLDPTNADAGHYVRFFRAAQHLNKALSLGKAGQLDEAAAEVAEAKKDDPSKPNIPEYEKWLQQLIQQREVANSAAAAKKAEEANQQAAFQSATQHLKRALDFGKAGRIEEAAAEVDVAKKDYPSHAQIPEFERWINQLRQQREAATKQEADQEQAGRDAAKKQEAQRAAEAERARQAEEQRRKEEAQRREAEASLAGTSWEGEAVIKMEEQVTMPIVFAIADNNVISGKIKITAEGETKEFDLQGTYDPGSLSFSMQFNFSGEGVSVQGKLNGKASSSNSAQGTVTMKISWVGVGEGETKGTWRISRK